MESSHPGKRGDRGSKARTELMSVWQRSLLDLPASSNHPKQMERNRTLETLLECKCEALTVTASWLQKEA